MDQYAIAGQTKDDDIIQRMRRFVSYRGADKSLARPGSKQVNVSVRMA